MNEASSTILEYARPVERDRGPVRRVPRWLSVSIALFIVLPLAVALDTEWGEFGPALYRPRLTVLAGMLVVALIVPASAYVATARALIGPYRRSKQHRIEWRLERGLCARCASPLPLPRIRCTACMYRR